MSYADNPVDGHEKLQEHLHDALGAMREMVDNLKHIVELLDMHDCFMSDGNAAEAKEILQQMLKGIE